MTVTEQPSTSEVFNQPPPLEGFNAFESNLPLVEAVEREGAGWAVDRLRTLGDEAGDRHTLELGRLANENPPKLKTHDRFGNRIDEVEFHPAWHELMHHAVGHGMAALPWREPGPGAHVARAAIMLTMSGVEAGTGCPISMTYAAVPALRKQPELAAEWEPRLTSLEYDGEELKPADQKRGALFGMAMTERQGGSDVRANITTRRADRRRRRVRAERPQVVLLGADVRRASSCSRRREAGVTCFLLPRFTPDGERNTFRINRLKDKLGNRSNASSEVEFDNTWAQHRRRGGPRRPDDHRDGQPHAARLRARLDRA